MSGQHLNLLPETVRRKYIWRKVIRRWFLISLLAVVIAGVHGWLTWDLVAVKKESVTQLESELEPLRGIDMRLSEVRNLIVKTDLLHQRVIREDARSRPVLTLLATVTEAIHSSGGTICVGDLEVERVYQQNQSTSPHIAHRLKLSGFSTGPMPLEDFVRSLKNSARFESVELVSSENAKRDGIPVTNYQIKCSY